MPESKVKIKLSELTDMYDIEDDSVEKTTKEQTQTEESSDWETTIADGDKKLEEEFDDAR